MTTAATVREFVRNFVRLRKVAASSGEVIVRDWRGQAFVLRATGEAGPALGEQLRDLRGAVATGVRVKRLKGFERMPRLTSARIHADEADPYNELPITGPGGGQFLPGWSGNRRERTRRRSWAGL